MLLHFKYSKEFAYTVIKRLRYKDMDIAAQLIEVMIARIDELERELALGKGESE